MKPQYSTKAILLATAAVAITCAGWLGYTTLGTAIPMDIMGPIRGLAFAGPLWVPLLFLAYALGRRSLTVPMVVLLAICEAAAVALMYVLRSNVP